MSTMRSWWKGWNSYFRPDIYLRLLPYMRPYAMSMIVVVVILLVQVGLGLVEPWTTKILVDNGLLGNPFPDWLLKPFPFLAGMSGSQIVLSTVAAGIVLHIIGKILEILSDYLKSWVNAGMTLAFQADLFNHLQRLSLSYHDQTTVGDSMYRLNNDTGFVSVLLWGNFRHLLRSGLTLIGMTWILLRLDWQIALLALAIAPFLYVSVGFYAKHFKAKSKRIKGMESMALTVVQEVLSCLRVVKAFGREDREQRRYEEKSWAALLARLRLSLEQAVFGSSMGFLTKLNRSLILLLGGYHVLTGQMSVGDLLVVLGYVSQIHGPLEDIGQILTDMQLSMVSAERTLEVLDTEPEIRDRPGAKPLDRVAGAISVEDVSFAYRTEHPVLHHVSLRVLPGEVIALVGPTGAGKTTLANLIARFYDPVCGRILLDTHDLRDLTVQTLRDNIALVIQEPILFTGTVRDNILYGKLDATMEEVVAAAKAANAHDFISELPDGYDSLVGERGVRLSGGERQRIAIARAFIKDAPVLILDEPTSSIDSRTELVILDALDRLMVGRTTFIIAHRLSTIRCADLILVLDKGRIVERGTHAELLAQGGIYAQMYRIQSSSLRREKEEVPA